VSAVRARRLFDGENFLADAAVVFEGRSIVAVQPGGPGERLSDSWLLVPGFVDLQVNGAGGVLFNQAPTVDGVLAIVKTLAALGTTALLPTLISAQETIPAALEATAAAIRAGVAGVLGVHIEGPFINLARRGIHPAHAVAKMRDDDAALLAAPHPGVRLVTLAPEMVASRHLRHLVQSGAIVFAGHSDATFEQATAALDDGVSGFTHLFNAMTQFGSRAPGCVGAAMAHNRAGASIICDGLHVHPASVRIAHRTMGADRLFLISDCMPTVGAAEAQFVWDGETISVTHGRLAKADGTLAGAHVTMAECVQRAVKLCGIPLGDALRMATHTPARHAGAPHVGRLAPGCRADMVALDPELRPVGVWQAGERIV
jgi:N-acetylglucosamine-6-phosphate deacetylase